MKKLKEIGYTRINCNKCVKLSRPCPQHSLKETKKYRARKEIENEAMFEFMRGN